MKSFERSQNSRPQIAYRSRAQKRNALLLQIERRSPDEADAKWRADMRHGVRGTLSLPPSMLSDGPFRGFRFRIL